MTDSLRFMLTPEQQFERDRQHFLRLLSLLHDALKSASEKPPRFPPIRSLMSEMADLCMAERCGLQGPPFGEDSWMAEEEQYQWYEWREPFINSASHAVRRTDGEFCRPDQPGAREKEARLELSYAVDRWIRAIQTMPVPPAFSVLSGEAVPGRDPALARDQLWRLLNLASYSFAQPDLVQSFDWAETSEFLSFARKANALARYEGLTTELIVRPPVVATPEGKPTRFHVLDPRGGRLVMISHISGEPPKPDDLAKLSHTIGIWRDLRAAQLLPRGDSTLPIPRVLSQPRDGGGIVEPEAAVPLLYDRLTAIRDTEPFNKVRASWRKALAGFIRACEKSSKLRRDQVTPEHHAWLRTHACELLEGKAGEHADTWMAYVRQGAGVLFGSARDRKHVRGRSIVSPAEADVRGSRQQ